MNILAVLPLAFVMVAGPQILSSFFFATSEGWRATSAAYVLGSAISISIVVTAAFLLQPAAGMPIRAHRTTPFTTSSWCCSSSECSTRFGRGRRRSPEVDGKDCRR